MIESTFVFHQFIQCPFTHMTEWTVPNVVGEGDGFREVFIGLQYAGQCAAYCGDFNRMRQPRSIMIGGAVDKHLRLVLEPAETPTVNNPVAVALKFRAQRMARLRESASPRGTASHGIIREIGILQLFLHDSGAKHAPRVGQMHHSGQSTDEAGYPH